MSLVLHEVLWSGGAQKPSETTPWRNGEPQQRTIYITCTCDESITRSTFIRFISGCVFGLRGGVMG